MLILQETSRTFLHSEEIADRFLISLFLRKVRRHPNSHNPEEEVLFVVIDLFLKTYETRSQNNITWLIFTLASLLITH